MEKRRCRRIDTDTLEAQIIGQDAPASAEISDISRFGVGIQELPRRINTAEPNLTILISGHGETFRMHIKPRWSVIDGWKESLGVSITEPTSQWLDFVDSLEPEKDDDISEK